MLSKSSSVVKSSRGRRRTTVRGPRRLDTAVEFLADIRSVASSRLPVVEAAARVRVSRTDRCSFSFAADGSWWISLSRPTIATLSNYAVASLLKTDAGTPLYFLALSSFAHEYAHAVWFATVPGRLIPRLSARQDLCELSEVPALWAQAETIARMMGLPRSQGFEILAREAGISMPDLYTDDGDDGLETDEPNTDDVTVVYGHPLALAASFGPAATLEDVVDETVERVVEGLVDGVGSA